MESKKQAAKFCGNILVRKARRRSFLAKSLFESVFGVLTEASFEYYQSSAQWVGHWTICKLITFATIIDYNGN